MLFPSTPAALGQRGNEWKILQGPELNQPSTIWAIANDNERSESPISFAHIFTHGGICPFMHRSLVELHHPTFKDTIKGEASWWMRPWVDDVEKLAKDSVHFTICSNCTNDRAVNMLPRGDQFDSRPRRIFRLFTKSSWDSTLSSS